MSIKYFETRQNPTNVPDEEMEKTFKCITEYFSYKWIKSNRSHPLQQLWNRRDALATNELYFFGACLQRIDVINPKWLKEQVRKIKADHANNRLGAFFEINGLGLLQNDSQQVVPAPDSNPGFDGTLFLTKEKIMRLSLKNYGDSAPYKEFWGHAKKIEELIKQNLKEKNVSPIQLVIDAVKGFPDKSFWESLEANVPELLQHIEKGNSKVFSISDFWLFMYGHLKDDYQDFHPAYNSYQLILTASYHKNEEKNLISKLDEACSNLVKYSKSEDEKIINAAFVHLPESASILKCREWSENYFEQYPEKPITTIILYQPTISSDIDKDTNFIHHCFQIIVKMGNFSNWNPEGLQINFSVPVGVLDFTPSQNKLYVEINGEKQTIDLKDKYVYQSGNLYLQGIRAADGSITGNVKQLASGIFAHSVFQPFPDQPAFTLSGHFPPVLKLLIL